MLTLSPIIIVVLTICVMSTVYSAGLQEIFTWTRIDYAWPHRARSWTSRSAYSEGGFDRQNVESWGGGQNIFGGVSDRGSTFSDQSGPSVPVEYNYVNNIPMGANVWRNKLFLSVPRRRPGIPSTLNYVPLNSRHRHNAPLIPYPSWSSNLYAPESGYCGHFVSVYRIAIDACDRLWFADTGIIESSSNKTVIKPHQLFIIDLHRDEIISSHIFPNDVIAPETILTQLTIDTTKEACGDAYAYFPDLSANGLIVFSLRQNRFWRVSHKSFFSEPPATKLNIGGHQFEWKDGIFSIQLSAVKPDGYRDVYYHALAAFHTYQVSSKVLRNELLATRSDHGNDFEIGKFSDNIAHSIIEDIRCSDDLSGVIPQRQVHVRNTRQAQRAHQYEVRMDTPRTTLFKDSFFWRTAVLWNDFPAEHLGYKGNNTQTSSADLHKPSGIMFLALINQNAVGCWNTNDDLSSLSLVHKDDQKMIYPSDLKLSGDNLYVLTNAVPRFIYGNLNYDEINFRVWSNSVEEAVRGTKCQNGPRPRRGY